MNEPVVTGALTTAAPARIGAKASGDTELVESPQTHFVFEHRVFKAAGARFLLKGQKKVPAFCVDMGDLEGVIDIDVLRKEFHIEPNSHDSKMIDTAVTGLRYVPDIKPGDTIPSEILTGAASWSVNPRHKKIAEQRLQVQLLSWVSGHELLITDPKEIELFLGQIENREKLRTAFRECAIALGFQGENTEAVIRQLELLARELCYIEALRDRFALIPRLAAKLSDLGKTYGNDRNAKLELNRVSGLLNAGIQEFTAIFEAADAQTGEIISALKSIDRQISYIRDVRDQLHFLIMQWDPHIENLGKWGSHRTTDSDKALANLYRFLAPRYSHGHSLLKRPPAGGSADKATIAKSPVRPGAKAKPNVGVATSSSSKKGETLPCP